MVTVEIMWFFWAAMRGIACVIAGWGLAPGAFWLQIDVKRVIRVSSALATGRAHSHGAACSDVIGPFTSRADASRDRPAVR
jgi:hypothetical protein